MIYLIGLLFVVIFGGFICAVLESCRGNWQKRVTVQDLEELGRLFEKEGSFIGYNDNGEKFLCGYPKD